jgi:hypothetical protein
MLTKANINLYLGIMAVYDFYIEQHKVPKVNHAELINHPKSIEAYPLIRSRDIQCRRFNHKRRITKTVLNKYKLILQAAHECRAAKIGEPEGSKRS